MIKALLSRPLSLPLAAVGGLTASQLPQAYTQYAQYLQGRVDEAELVAEQASSRLAEFTDQYAVASLDALKIILSSESGRAARLLEGDVSLFEGQVQRFEWLQQSLTQLGEGVPVLRFGTFATKLQPEFVAGTIKNFQPGIPASFDLVMLGEIAVVIVVGWLVFYGLGRVVEALFGRLRRGGGKGKRVAQ